MFRLVYDFNIRFLKSTIIQKAMHFRIDSNAFVRGYLILGE
jgi:hypothetical protein